MVDIPLDTVGRVPPAEVAEVDLYHPKSWVTKYVFSQDAKVIAIQYSVTALSIGALALMLSWLMRLQLGFPGILAFIDAAAYYQFVTMHGMMMVVYVLTALFLGGFGNYLIPLMVGARDMVFPYANMLSYWLYLLAVFLLLASFFVPGGPTGAGWTLYPPQAILSGTPGREWGVLSDAHFLDHLHHRLHHGWTELCGDGSAGSCPRDDADANALDRVGNFHRELHGIVGVSRSFGRRRHDAAGSASWYQLLHAVAG